MISLRIHSAYTDANGLHEFWEHDSHHISKALFEKAVCSGEYKVGNVAVGALRVTVPRYLYNSGSRVELFRDGVKIHGDFFIGDRQEIKRGFWLEITCYDALYKANYRWEQNQKGKIGTHEIMSKISERLGVTWSGNLSGWQYPKEDLFDKKLSEILSFIAKDNGGNFAMRGNVLTFIPLWYSGGTTHHITENTMMLDDFNLDYRYFSRVKMGQFTEGDDSGDTLEIDSNYPTAEKCRIIQSNISGVPYKSFCVDKARVYDDNIDIGDLVSFAEREDILYKPTKISAIYNDSGCFAELSAGRSEESRKEFEFKGPISTQLKNKIDKNKLYGGNKIGDYGFKSIAVRPKTPQNPKLRATQDEEEEQATEQLRIHDGVISAEDISDEENPVECGKVFYDRTDEANQSINMEMNGLLTNAKDVRGAINELFAQGTSGGWVRPKEWIELPEPEDNEIKILVYISESNGKGSSGYVGVGPSNRGTEQDFYVGNTYFDWGDGSTETIDYYGNILHNYTAAGQYIVTVSVDRPHETSPYFLNLDNAVTVKVGAGFSWKCLYINVSYALKELYLKGGNQTELATGAGGYIAGGMVSGCLSLEKFDIPDSVERIGETFLSNSNVPGGKIVLPNVKTVGNSFLSGARGLVSISLPSLQTAGDSFCNSCYGLETAEIPSTTQFGNFPFNYCSIVNIRRIDTDVQNQ